MQLSGGRCIGRTVKEAILLMGEEKEFLGGPDETINIVESRFLPSLKREVGKKAPSPWERKPPSKLGKEKKGWIQPRARKRKIREKEPFILEEGECARIAEEWGVLVGKGLS